MIDRANFHVSELIMNLTELAVVNCDWPGN